MTIKYAPVGLLVYSGYWHEEYRVLSHNPDGSVTIRWVTGLSAGRRLTHRTPFDYRDRIVIEAEGRSHRVTLATYQRINALVPTARYAIAYSHTPLGAMSGERLAATLRTSRWPERLTYHRVLPKTPVYQNR
jgi:hypothetical protein